MKYLSIILFFTLISTPLFSQNTWKDVAVTENNEIYVDTASINYNDGKIYARIKTIYTTDSARQAYVDKIKRVFRKNADKKISKWIGFSYNISYGIYDCNNKRFKIIEVEDYTADDKQIIKTKRKEDKTPWTLIDIDTVGDYQLFYICDKLD